MKLAIIQDGPEYFNLKKTLQKTHDLLAKASSQGADVVVFGECWLTGYPVWLDICSDVNLWDDPDVKSLWATMHANSISINTDEFNELCTHVKELGVHVIIGANEKVSTGPGNGTLYNSILTIDKSGSLVNHHRKLMPTYTEKLVHGLGDGAGLNAVETSHGRIGSLICWEHWMPLARQTMHDAGEDLHIALWPHVKELHQVASRHYAHEGRCYVAAVGQVMHVSELPAGLSLSPKIKVPDDGIIMKGGSAIYGPDGSIILEPIYGKREIIMAELDLSTCVGERMNLDVTGHYQRSDVFDFNVNKLRRS